MFWKLGLIGLVALAVLVSACTVPMPQLAQNKTTGATGAATTAANKTAAATTPSPQASAPAGGTANVPTGATPAPTACCPPETPYNIPPDIQLRINEALGPYM